MQQQQLKHYVVYVRGHYAAHRKTKEEAIEIALKYLELKAENVWVSEEAKRIIWADGKELVDE